MIKTGIRESLVFVSLGAMVLLAVCPSAPDPVEPFEPPEFVYGERTPNTKRLMNYLADQYGKKIISGQMDTSWTTNASMDMIARVFADTGKYPALKGFDMMELPLSWSNYGMEQIEEAIKWWEGKNRNNGDPPTTLLPKQPDIHGIVAFCWHWRMPPKTGTNPPEFYTERTDYRIPWKDGKLDTGSDIFKRTIIADLDKAAELLKILRDRDIPVLWRPLHEAVGNWRPNNPAGAWFWWGASGPEPYIALWEYMHDYFTGVKQLDNLIWVWNGQHEDWFPNPDTVDIVGYDYYPWPQNTPQQARNYNSQVNLFIRTRDMVPEKNRIVALTENGAIPDPDKCRADGAMWSWFMVWNDDRNNLWASNNPDTDHAGNFWHGQFHNTNAHKKHVYNHNLVITLDQLPDLTKYRLE